MHPAIMYDSLKSSKSQMWAIHNFRSISPPTCRWRRGSAQCVYHHKDLDVLIQEWTQIGITPHEQIYTKHQTPDFYPTKTDFSFFGNGFPTRWPDKKLCTFNNYFHLNEGNVIGSTRSWESDLWKRNWLVLWWSCLQVRMSKSFQE